MRSAQSEANEGQRCTSKHQMFRPSQQIFNEYFHFCFDQHSRCKICHQEQLCATLTRGFKMFWNLKIIFS